MSDPSVQDYAIAAVNIISKARREGYDPRILADAINTICLPTTSSANWGQVGDIRTTAMALCAEYAQHTMAAETRKAASNVRFIR